MFSKNKITEYEVAKLRGNDPLLERDVLGNSIDDMVLRATDAYGTIDGTKLQEAMFPTSKHFDIFLSHSHADEDRVLRFAAWIKDNLGLNCFIDSVYWNYVGKLQKSIDNKYCMTSDRCYYDYDSRNMSTSHLHSMLAMALMEMIDKTECFIFIGSGNSLSPQNLKAETFSPWIYQELSFAAKVRRTIPDRFARRQIRSFSQGGKLVENKLRICYNVGDVLGDMDEMTADLFGQAAGSTPPLDVLQASTIRRLGLS